MLKLISKRLKKAFKSARRRKRSNPALCALTCDPSNDGPTGAEPSILAVSKLPNLSTSAASIAPEVECGCQSVGEPSTLASSRRTASTAPQSIRSFNSDHSLLRSDHYEYDDLLTVFQAEPLACVGPNQELREVASLDFEYERDILLKTIKEAGDRIAVCFEKATTDRLGAFLASGQGRVLHFSCHGHPQYLAVEDEWGSLQCLEVSRLKEWIRFGGQRLQLVFVSACHSHSIGQAFVDAGVPHVVCCSQGIGNVRSDAAVEFEKAFYRALACGNVLSGAFDLACQEIKNWPQLNLQDRAEAGSQFCLLPADGGHDVEIFFTDPIARRRVSIFSTNKTSSVCSTFSFTFPAPPEIFVGRSVDKFRVLQALKSSRFVRVCGKAGIGKSSVVKACCRWIGERLSILGMDEILWVPFGRFVHEEGLMGWFDEVFEAMQGDNAPLEAFQEECSGLVRKIIRYLQEKRVLLVMEAKNLTKLGRMKLFSIIECLLLETSQHVKVVVIHRDGEGGQFDDQRLPCVESVVEVGSLEIDAAVKLFSVMCRHVSNRTCPTISSSRDLVQLLVPNRPVTRLSKRLYSIANMLGNGVPDEIHRVAKHMSVEEYMKLVGFGNQEEHEIRYSCRTELLKRSEEVKSSISTAVAESNFRRAHWLQGYYDEIVWILRQLPDIRALKQTLDSVRWEMDVAVSAGDWSQAESFKLEIQRLEAAIRLEQCGGFAHGMDTDEEPVETRAEIDARIDGLKKDLSQAESNNDFGKAKELDATLRRLEDLKSAFPGKMELLDQVSLLEKRLEEAKSEREWQKAELIHGRLEEFRAKVATEIEAEDSLKESRRKVPSDIAAAINLGELAEDGREELVDKPNEAAHDDKVFERLSTSALCGPNRPGALSIAGPNVGDGKSRDAAESDLPVAYEVSNAQLKKILRRKKERMFIRIRREVLLEGIRNTRRRRDSYQMSHVEAEEACKDAPQPDIVLPVLNSESNASVDISQGLEAGGLTGGLHDGSHGGAFAASKNLGASSARHRLEPIGRQTPERDAAGTSSQVGFDPARTDSSRVQGEINRIVQETIRNMTVEAERVETIPEKANEKRQQGGSRRRWMPLTKPRKADRDK